DRPGRFDIHELLRQYAAEKLDEVPEERDGARAAHAQYYLGFAGAAVKELKGPQQHEHLARLEREHNNLRSALLWAVQSANLQLAIGLTAAVWRFWYLRGYYAEGRAHLESVLSLLD